MAVNPVPITATVAVGGMVVDSTVDGQGDGKILENRDVNEEIFEMG